MQGRVPSNKNPANMSEQKWARNFSIVRRYTVCAWQRKEKRRNSDDVSPHARRKTPIKCWVPGYLGRDILYVHNSMSGPGYLGRDILHSDSVFYVVIMYPTLRRFLAPKHGFWSKSVLLLCYWFACISATEKLMQIRCTGDHLSVKEGQPG